ncbi:hypothetical protein FOZ62_017174 [Perkinsus olseni]|uniref:PARP-type domain-containing protein n=1 Tax=Perkinsus olseni TaxID=32597 RepID=A0A7J6QPN8_PEROL|nr:hypothetical protein FOZ62_017174 [Perkinsus olseni]
MQLQAQHKELSKKLRQEMQQQKSEAKNKKKIAVVVEPSAPISETPVALPKAPEAVADTPVETPPRKKRGRPPKGATSAKRKKEEVPSTGQPEKETAGATEPKTPVSVKGGIPEVPESASSSSSLPPPSTPSGSDEEGSVRRHSRRRRGHMDAAEAYRLAACQGLVDTNPYDKWAHDAAEAQQTRIAEEEVREVLVVALFQREALSLRSGRGGEGERREEEDREVREKEIEEKRKELKEKQQEKARLKAEIKAHRKEQQERIVEQVLQMEHDKAAALDGVAAGGTKSDSVRRDAASGIIRIRAKPSPVPSSTMPTSLPEGEVPAAEGSSSSSSFSAARPGELLAQAAEEAVREVQELSPSPSEAPTPSMSSGFHGDDEEPADEVMESEASVGDEGSDYEEDDIVTVGRRVRGVKRSTPAAAAAGTAATTSKSKRRRGPLVTAGSKRRSSVSSPSGNADEPKSPGGLFSPGGDGATSTVNPRKLYREKATEGFRKLFEAGDVADDEESKEERCRKWATELEAALFITTGGKNGESGWQKYLEAMKRLVPVIKDTQSKEKQRHLKREGDDAQASPLLTRPIGVTGLLLRGRLSVDQLASKHCTSEWLQEMIGWDDLLLEDPTSDNRVKPIQGLRGILFRECLDPSKGVIHPGKRSAMQCHLWSYALEHEMHASSNDAASYRQAIGGLVRKLRELESNSLPAFRLLHTNKITCKRLASTSAGTIVSENAPHRTSSAASSGGSTPGGGSSPKAASPAESSAAAVVLSRTAPTAQSTEPDLYDDLAVDAGVPKLPTSGSEPTSVSLKRVASALITAEEELQESAPDFAPAPMIMMEDDESDDDEEESVDEDDHDGDRSRDPGHSPPPVVSEGTWVALWRFWRVSLVEYLLLLLLHSMSLPAAAESELYDKKWTIGFAPSGRSSCKNTKCLHADEPDGKKIPKGSLRIGRKFPSPFDPDAVAVNWFHYDCMFDQFTRARKGTQIIESGDDMDGWDDLTPDAKAIIEKCIKNEQHEAPAPKDTPSKKRASTKRSTQGSKTPHSGKKGSKTPVKKTVEKKAVEKKRRSSVGTENRRDKGRIVML